VVLPLRPATTSRGDDASCTTTGTETSRDTIARPDDEWWMGWMERVVAVYRLKEMGRRWPVAGDVRGCVCVALGSQHDV
jgi:hypothetical protein